MDGPHQFSDPTVLSALHPKNLVEGVEHIEPGTPANLIVGAGTGTERVPVTFQASDRFARADWLGGDCFAIYATPPDGSDESCFVVAAPRDDRAYEPARLLRLSDRNESFDAATHLPDDPRFQVDFITSERGYRSGGEESMYACRSTIGPVAALELPADTNIRIAGEWAAPAGLPPLGTPVTVELKDGNTVSGIVQSTDVIGSTDPDGEENRVFVVTLREALERRVVLWAGVDDNGFDEPVPPAGPELPPFEATCLRFELGEQSYDARETETGYAPHRINQAVADRNRLGSVADLRADSLSGAASLIRHREEPVALPASGHLSPGDPGTEAWRTTVAPDDGEPKPIRVDPILGERYLYVCSGFSVRALDPTSGEIQWSTSFPGHGIDDAILVDGVIYVYTSDSVERLYALDLETGEYRPEPAEPVAEPGVGGGSLVAGPAGEQLFVGGEGLAAVDLVAGEVTWRAETVGPVKPAPVVGAGVVAAHVGEGEFVGHDIETGEVRWRVETEGRTGGAPAFEAGTIYVGDGRRTLFAIEAATGELVWEYDSKSAVHAAPAVADGRLFATCNSGTIHVIDARTGTDDGAGMTGGKGRVSPTVADDALYIADQSTRLWAFERDSLSMRWNFKLPTASKVSPAVGEKHVYAATTDGTVHGVYRGVRDD